MNAKIIEFRSITKEEKSKMETLQNKAKITGQLFINGFSHTFTQDENLQVAVGVGLYQGLKYNGSFKRGLKAASTTMAVIATVNGVLTVMSNVELIQKVK